MIKKIFLFVVGILAAIFALLAGVRKVKGFGVGAVTVKDKGTEFEKKAEEVRQSVADRIRSLPARTVAEQYGGVCDAVTEGRNRFAAGVKGVLDKGGGGGLD